MQASFSGVGSAESSLVRSFRSLKISCQSPAGNLASGRRIGLVVQARTTEPAVGLFGTKAAMRTFYAEDGKCLPATIIGFKEGNIVAQIKTDESDGYNAVQVGYDVVPERKLSKMEVYHLKKYGCPPMRHLREYKLRTQEEVTQYEPGQQLKVDEVFKAGDMVDIAGKTIGKGFQGAIKRWHHARGMKTHGSKSYRQHGSIGSGSATPSRVFPGMKMAGQMGNKRTKIRKLEVLDVNAEDGYIVVKGAVPGKSGNLLEITPAKTVGVNC